MNGHLTEQQLIDYQFKLASDAGMDEARVHLEGCEACRQRLTQLGRKFAALELLREEVKASDALISRTLETAAKPRRARIIPFLSLPWLGAAAAAIVVGVAVFVTPNLGPQGQRQEVLTPPTAMERMDAPKDKAEESLASKPRSVAVAPPQLAPDTYAVAKSLSDSAADGSVRSVPARAEKSPQLSADSPRQAFANPADNRELRTANSGQTPYGVTTSALADGLRSAQPDGIDDKPPFAPASAIELVVLPRRENVQLTIYNGADLTLVRERRNLTLKQGWNWLQFMWANTLIDPTSLTLEPLEHKDGVQVQQLVFPPRLRELGRWLIRSDVTGQVPFELTYFTGGLSWRAFYMGTLSQDEKTMRLEAYVRVNNNSGEDYEDAQTRLIVGRVHLLDEIAKLAKRQYPYDRPMRSREADKRRLGGTGWMKDYELKPSRPGSLYYSQSQLIPVEPKEIRKEGLSEYFLYTIEGTETIPDKWGKRLLSMEVGEIPVKALYKYDEERWGTQTIQFVSFANDEEHKLGETPLPDGTIRIYGRADEQGHLSYVGGANVKYIPVGEEVELNLGPARLVEVKPSLMEERTENYAFDQNGSVSGFDEVQTWKIEVTNTRTLPVDIEITRGFGTAYWALKPANATVSYEKHDASHARFKLTIGSRTRRAFEYVVTIYHGARRDAYSQ